MNHNDSQDDPYVFTSVRYDPILTKCIENNAASCNSPCPVYLLEHQWTRMSVAKWTLFGKAEKGSVVNNATSSPSHLLSGLLSAVNSWHMTHPAEQADSLRIRVRIYLSGRITTEVWPIPRVPLTQLFPLSFGLPDQLADKAMMTVTIDVDATEASESTMYKTSDRSVYGRARAAACIFSVTSLDEVLLHNTEGFILDGSQATPYFYRDGQWVTPSSSCGGQQGTTRRWALKKGLAVEADISKDSLRPGECIWLSSAVPGFRVAVYHERRENLQPPDINDCKRISRQLR